MKKILFVCIFIGMVNLMVGCEKRNTEVEKSDTLERSQQTRTSESIQMPNPFQTVSSIEEAATIAGFSMEVPKEVFGYDEKIIQAIRKDMIQVIYQKSDGSNQSITIRKTNGTRNDISGYYGEYDEETIHNSSGNNVVLRKKEEKFFVASWQSNDSSFAVSSKNGLTKSFIEELVNQTK